MELEDLKSLMELLKETDITELQIEKEGTKVKIKREKFFGHLDVQQSILSEKKEAKEMKQIKEEAAEEEGKLFTVTSPIVGTFYRSPSPESEPFVDVGSRVRRGQVLCIIEAMKLMNEIENEVDGVVVRILVDNGHPVEYGEPLFLIEPV
ncbi:MAG: acetyl-CoA carboxylase biotin carboxyl carrier protein [Nitrospirales bacterium]|nr:acetyl-CoA carboxylase biotin carboxyl carrier protein [Nitrospirales bacterium]